MFEGERQKKIRFAFETVKSTVSCDGSCRFHVSARRSAVFTWHAVLSASVRWATPAKSVDGQLRGARVLPH